VGTSLAIKTEFCELKDRPFECGFTPQSKARLPFSIRFFLVALLFVIFDVELVLLFPFISAGGAGKLIYCIAVAILLGGLTFEINQGGLN